MGYKVLHEVKKLSSLPAMRDPFFFGYGSLVNVATHIYDETHPAKVTGWRRCWRHTTLRDLAFLSVEPCAGSTIDGLIAKVPQSDWAALDLRETGYNRAPLNAEAMSHGAGNVHVEMYQTDSSKTSPKHEKHPILLSYLDTVVQGFLQIYGKDGVQRFFDTTVGWDAPILNDRSNPQYPRTQILTKAEVQLVDDHLAHLAP